MAAPSVKFDRLIRIGDVGKDVIAVKRVTSRAGFWPWAEFNATATKEFMDGRGKGKRLSGLRGFQKFLGVQVDGQYGPQTHAATLKARVPKGLPHAGEYVWDGWSVALYKGAYPDAHARAVVADVFKWWQWMVDREPEIHYSQNRPMVELQRHHKPPQLPFKEDCSSTFIYCAFLGGAISPDQAYGYTGYGNTGSLVRCGLAINENQINEYAGTHYVGVYYGPSVWETHHVAAAMSTTKLYSMGQESAPEIYHSISDGPGNVAAIRAHAVV